MTSRDLDAPTGSLAATAAAAPLAAAHWIPIFVDRVVREFQPLQIILFGSRARGTARPDSDVDLLVVLSHVEDKRRTTIAILDALHDRLVPVDVLVTTPEEIGRRGHVAGTALRAALREGQVLYERPVGASLSATGAGRRVWRVEA